MGSRKGLVDLLATPPVFGLIVVMLFLGGFLANMVGNKTADKSGLFYNQQAMGEVLDAPCAVDSRGVFYESAVKNGEFGCLNPHGETEIVLLFKEVDGSQYRWSATRTDSGVTVQQSSTGLQNPQTYTVLIYDRQEGTKTPAVLEVGAK